MQAVILAAGLGTRLRPLTLDRSKAMVPVLGRPLVERALMPLMANGVRDFVFVVSPEDREIREYFENRTTLQITSRFVVQEERLGTAHALGTAVGLIDGPLVVWACDSLVDHDHVEALLEAGEEADAVLSLLDVTPELVSRSAAVELEGSVVRRIVEKPRLEEAPSNTVSLPHYLFAPRFLALLPRIRASSRGEYEIPDAIQALIDTGGRVVGVRATNRQQVSTPGDLLALTRRLLSVELVPTKGQPVKAGRSTKLIEPLRIEQDVVIGDGCEIGPEVFLESGCHIGDRAVVRRSIVLRGGHVRNGAKVEDEVVT